MALSAGDYCGRRKRWTGRWGERRGGKCSGRGGHEAGAAIRGAPALVGSRPAGPQQPSWCPSPQHPWGQQERWLVARARPGQHPWGAQPGQDHAALSRARQRFRNVSAVASRRAHGSARRQTPAPAMPWVCRGGLTPTVRAFMLMCHRFSFS